MMGYLIATLAHELLLRKILGVKDITYFKGLSSHVFSSPKAAKKKKTTNNTTTKPTTLSYLLRANDEPTEAQARSLRRDQSRKMETDQKLKGSIGLTNCPEANSHD